MNLNPAFILATSLRAASVTHLGDAIRLRWQAGSRCAVRVTPNAEGDVQFPGHGHRAFVLGMTYSGSEPLKVRTRLRGSGWPPAHTELWADHDLVPGEVELRLDTREFRLCQNAGPSDVLELEWIAKDAGELRLREFACVPLGAEEAFAPLVDRYGQRIHGEWPEKIHSDEDLVRDSSQALLAATPGRDRFGGWEDGVKSDATGFFRAEQREDGWWLITPEGGPFLSFGACCVTPGCIRTKVKGREHLFEELPSREGKLQEAWQGARPGKKLEAEMYTRNSYGGDTDSSIVNFAIANMIRKWGEDWFRRWSRQSVGRLRHWGMNTLGCWSDLELCQSANMPYCLMADRVCPAPFEDLVPGAAADCFPLRTIPDVCHPEFVRKAEGWFDGLTSFASDRFLLGYFVGNEERWCLWKSPFALPLSWESRRSFLRELEEKYSTVEALNRAWNTGFASFKDLGDFHQNENPPGISPEGEADCDAFMRRFTDRYFSIVRRELLRADPNHSFWGCRFLALPPKQCILEGAAPHMDVVSINWYLWHKQSPADAADFLRDWHERCGGKPLVISEYSFTATDERLLACHRFHRDQTARARIASDVTECCQRLPFVVGMHWFQYIDQPITGRTLSDGERGNFGLVDVADRPHAEIVAALKASGDRLYAPRVDYSVWRRGQEEGSEKPAISTVLSV